MKISLVYLPGQKVYLCPDPCCKTPGVLEGLIRSVTINTADKVYTQYGFLPLVKHFIDGNTEDINTERLVWYYPLDMLYPTCSAAWEVYKDCSKRKEKTAAELTLTLSFNVGETFFAQACLSAWDANKHPVLQDLDIIRGKIESIHIELTQRTPVLIHYGCLATHRKSLRGKIFHKNYCPYREAGLYHTEEEVRGLLETILAARLEAKREVEVFRLEEKLRRKQNKLSKLKGGDTACLIY